MTAASALTYRDPAFVQQRLQRDIDFFTSHAFDPKGGFFHYLNDDGSVYDAASRHLVNSTRMVFCHALAYRQSGKEAHREAARHGLRFIEEKHWQADYGGYAWVLNDGLPVDRTQHCYGLAFVLLAYAHAFDIGITEAQDGIGATFALMEKLFWSEQDGLYADEATPGGEVASYRGQNANMHSCEALLAAFEATGELRYLHRAERLARNITVRQAALANGWIWEHYHADWRIDWDYNRHDNTNMFRPWGYQPGHMTEWAKLLLILERHAAHLQEDAGWLVPRAQALFDATIPVAWDQQHGGLVYGIAPDMQVCDGDKYFWVQAESMATAALLAQRTGVELYWEVYEGLWAYSMAQLIDVERGGWYRILQRDNTRYGPEKPPHGKTDFYHPLGAYLESLQALGAPLPKRR
ncbi:mannose/cellobiose epimerase-like protein (N-acyl-D-glucosamine 2-epimerase family) [Herbaspirillum sp. Sphag1AN]|uniref:AGE family epimerase/isomerase n=1 Tax=unclassified Herbaspirillum TaxID=2624150 RepID=UPI00161686AD|nr:MULTISPECIES: AGE family epimerase/isomerase [unclassified Herbaspirillum]MBB3211387.1 mannose/cellobiose epimerase-like protein (N-acyl-D-glucosamine 2-epimerase family) [Herbaspirillum sp. Sphag1AN]MBB3245346.1 mannose/cellobiose epimerase-like protein (N-acyl-D-glucosamine 2-epimerase family) [Herbaspirillum sp. Sphag64]